MADKSHTLISRVDARSQGLKHYFTGIPCHRGHTAPRYVSVGICVQCAEHNRKSWRSNNPERTRELHREWRRANPERERLSHIKSNRKWWGKIKTRANAERRKHWAANREKIAAERRKRSAADYAKNKRRITERFKQWCLKNPIRIKQIRARATKKWEAVPENVKAKTQNRRARKQNNGGTHTAADIAEIFKAQRGKCGYCRTSLQKKYHVDHIVALANGGSNGRRNLQILCGPCNLRKHASDPIDYARSLGMLL